MDAVRAGTDTRTPQRSIYLASHGEYRSLINHVFDSHSPKRAASLSGGVGGGSARPTENPRAQLSSVLLTGSDSMENRPVRSCSEPLEMVVAAVRAGPSEKHAPSERTNERVQPVACGCLMLVLRVRGCYWVMGDGGARTAARLLCISRSRRERISSSQSQQAVGRSGNVERTFFSENGQEEDNGEDNNNDTNDFRPLIPTETSIPSFSRNQNSLNENEDQNKTFEVLEHRLETTEEHEYIDEEGSENRYGMSNRRINGISIYAFSYPSADKSDADVVECCCNSSWMKFFLAVRIKLDACTQRRKEVEASAVSRRGATRARRRDCSVAEVALALVKIDPACYIPATLPSAASHLVGMKNYLAHERV
ncbi:hypothetical protein CBL_14659 [Carabus blaptoides fortunei]